MVKRLLLVALVVAAVAGCRRPRVREANWILPPTVVVSTPGLVIEAADGS